MGNVSHLVLLEVSLVKDTSSSCEHLLVTSLYVRKEIDGFLDT